MPVRRRSDSAGIAPASASPPTRTASAAATSGSASTASSAGRLPWMSYRAATRIRLTISWAGARPAARPARPRARHHPQPGRLDVASDDARARPPANRRPDRVPPRPGGGRRGPDRDRGDRDPLHRAAHAAHARRLPARHRARVPAAGGRRPRARHAPLLPALPRRPRGDLGQPATAGRGGVVHPLGPLPDRAARTLGGGDRTDARRLPPGVGVRARGRPRRRRGVRRVRLPAHAVPVRPRERPHRRLRRLVREPAAVPTRAARGDARRHRARRCGRMPADGRERLLRRHRPGGRDRGGRRARRRGSGRLHLGGLRRLVDLPGIDVDRAPAAREAERDRGLLGAREGAGRRGARDRHRPDPRSRRRRPTDRGGRLRRRRHDAGHDRRPGPGAKDCRGRAGHDLHRLQPGLHRPLPRGHPDRVHDQPVDRLRGAAAAPAAGEPARACGRRRRGPGRMRGGGGGARLRPRGDRVRARRRARRPDAARRRHARPRRDRDRARAPARALARRHGCPLRRRGRGCRRARARAGPRRPRRRRRALPPARSAARASPSCTRGTCSAAPRWASGSW